MTSDNRTSAEIERDIEHERDRLSDNLEALQDTLSPETLVREAGDQLRRHGGDISRSISNAAKDNPLALTLTGIGLAWMMFGNRSYAQTASNGVDHSTPHPTPRAGGAGRDHAVLAASPRTRADFGETAWAIRERDADPDGHDDDGIGDRLNEGKDRAAQAADTARGKMAELGEQAKRSGQRSRDTFSSAAADTEQRLTRLYRRLAAGTEDLSDAARERIVAARREALVAREKLRSQARTHAQTASNIYEQQPLVAGALALAVGAAVGAALPRTDVEDDMMGEQSDALFREAERVYREERDKAARVAEATVEEAKTVARETKRELDESAPGDQTAAEAVTGKARAAAKRVSDKTQKKAKAEKLGSSNS